MLYRACPKEQKMANGQKGGKRKAKEIPSLHFLEKTSEQIPRRKQCSNSWKGFVKDRQREELAAEQPLHTLAFAGLLAAPQLPRDQPTRRRTLQPSSKGAATQGLTGVSASFSKMSNRLENTLAKSTGSAKGLQNTPKNWIRV